MIFHQGIRVGVETGYGHISDDLLRYLGVMSDIKHGGLFAANSHDVILGIGGGYGGLASARLMQAPDIRYIICDLEETILSRRYTSEILSEAKRFTWLMRASLMRNCVQVMYISFRNRKLNFLMTCKLIMRSASNCLRR